MQPNKCNFILIYSKYPFIFFNTIFFFWFISSKENQTELGHYRSEEDILDRLENGTDYTKRSVEVESMESLDDPDDFFGSVHKESNKKTEWRLKTDTISKINIDE